MGPRSHPLNPSGGNRVLAGFLIELVLIVLAVSALSPKTMNAAEPYWSRSNTQQDEQDSQDEQDWEEDQQQQLEREWRARQERNRRERARQELERQEFERFYAERLNRTMDGQQGGTVSLITLAAPGEAKKAYENAGKEFSKGKPNLSKVTKELEKAVEIYPEFAVAWQMLGEVRLAQNDRPAASEAFEQARAADPGYVAPYLSQAMMAMEEEQWMKAAQLSGQALELSPQLIKAHYFNALANISLGRINTAEESALLVLDSNQVQTYPLIYYVLGSVEAQRENFPSAAARYRTFLEVRPNASLAEEVRGALDEWRKQGLIQ